MRRTILLTGSSSGIGLETLKLLVDKYNVISLSRTSPLVESENFIHYKVDFSKNCEKKIDGVMKKHPEITDLVLCHGLGHFGNLENLSYPQIEEMMHVNFSSYVTILKTILPTLKQKAYSRVITIGSSSAIKGGPQGSIYCASKFALRGFIESLQEECGKSCVAFTQVHPGMVRTPFFDHTHFGPGDHQYDAIEPKDVAAAIDLALSSREGTILSDIRLKALHRVIKKRDS